MKTRTLVALLSCIALVFCLYVTPSVSAASDEEEVFQVMTDWFKAFNTNDYELMASLHWNSTKISKFDPNKSGALLRQGWDAIGKDWKSSFEVPVGTYINSLHHPQVTVLDGNVAIITGYNTAIYTDPTTKEQSISQVRGTFVVQKINGKWLIVHEHSSVLPTE